MAAELIRCFRDPRRHDELISVYKCSGCGKEVYLKRKIPGRETYCGACVRERNRKRKEKSHALIVSEAMQGYARRLKELIGQDHNELTQNLMKIIGDMEKGE